jgi:2-keto-3-deoxy-L-rhamnonate aldolase RhmA
VIAANTLKQKLAGGAVATATLALDLRAPAYVHLLADAGYDSIFFDLEHGIYDLPIVADLIGITRALGVTPIVRVPDLRYGDIARLLDAGAQGVMFPRIDTVEQVHEAIRCVKYPPMGERGAASVRGATAYREVPPQTLISAANAQTMVIIQIERAESLTNLDAIASTAGVDMLLVGPYDLAIALGATSPADPVVVAAMDRVVAAGKRHGVVTGTHGSDPATMRSWRDKGMQMLLCGSDLRFFAQGAKAMLADLQG